MLLSLLHDTIRDIFLIIDPTLRPPINTEAINFYLITKHYHFSILYNLIFVNHCKMKTLLYILLKQTRLWNLLTSPQSHIPQSILQCIVIEFYFLAHFQYLCYCNCSSSHPIVTKCITSRFSEVVRISRWPRYSNLRLLQCFFFTLLTVDCHCRLWETQRLCNLSSTFTFDQ